MRCAAEISLMVSSASWSARVVESSKETVLHLDGLVGLGIALLALTMMRVFPDSISREAKDLPWLAYGVFVIPQTCFGVVRLCGGGLQLALGVGTFSTWLVAAALAVFSIWHLRRRTEFLITAGMLAFLGLAFGMPFLLPDEMVTRGRF